MPVPPNQREPRAKGKFAARQIRPGGDPDNADKATIAWQFRRLDRPHENWGWDKLHPPQWKSVLNHLISFEGLTWAKLQEQSGGRKTGTNHHSIDRDKFTAEAQKRLAELGLDEFDTIFSLRLTNTLRLYGIREGRVLQIFWHDPHHGSKIGACPTTK